jgi:ribosomal protein S18 acetylase RimI-like enzyme
MALLNYQLRPATDDDYDFLYHLHVATIQPYVAATWGWDDTIQTNFFRQKFDPAKRQIILLDGKPAGVLSVEEQESETFLALIEILPEYQGRGLGTAVIHDLIHTAQQHGRPVTLHVLKTNHPARRLYERLGFTITAETPTHYHMKREA